MNNDLRISVMDELTSKISMVYGERNAWKYALEYVTDEVGNIYLSEGNKKLKKTDKVNFAIFSLPAVVTCPNSTAMCRSACYARKAERQYPNVKKCRDWNLRASMPVLAPYSDTRRCAFILAMCVKLEKLLFKAKKQGRELFVRVHESGDFYDVDYYKAWLTIASIFVGEPVRFLAYTKSIHIVKGIDKPSNFTLIFSLWDDTPITDRAVAKEERLPIYSAHKVLPEHVKKCVCEDCASCGICYHAQEGDNIGVQIH